MHDDGIIIIILLQAFARRQESYVNPIYSGAHFLLKNNAGGGTYFVRFMATYYRYGGQY